MTAAYISNVTTQSVALHMAFELSWNSWKVAFTTGHGQQPRLRTIRARDLAALEQEIAKAKKRFKLDPDTPVFSCYEAGRDGFWLHRYLITRGIVNVIVDSASIEVNRRKRRAKSDKLDANKLVSMLVRYRAGERKVWSVVRVPNVADEDNRQLHRDLQELLDERTRHINRIKGLLARGWRWMRWMQACPSGCRRHGCGMGQQWAPRCTVGYCVNTNAGSSCIGKCLIC
jgi:transposase